MRDAEKNVLVRIVRPLEIIEKFSGLCREETGQQTCEGPGFKRGLT